MSETKKEHYYFEIGLFVKKPDGEDEPLGKWFTDVPVLPRPGDILVPRYLSVGHSETFPDKLRVEQVEYMPDLIEEEPYVGSVIKVVYVAIRTSPIAD